MRARSLLAALVLVALGAADSSAGPQDPPALSVGPPVERSLSFGHSERFRVGMSVDESVHVRVEQHGIDVVVEVRDPADAVVARFDDNLTSHGSEDVEVTSAGGGAYTIVVEPAPGAVSAGAFAIHLDDRRPATAADREVQAARTLLVRAGELGAADRLDDARADLERALALVERARGRESLDATRVVYALGINAMDRRSNAAAEAYLDRAITSLDQTAGTGDPFDAVVRSRLAILYERTGRRPQAEAAARQAQDVFERTLGRQHVWTLRNLVTLANLRYDAGDMDRSRELVLQAMALAEGIHQDQSLTYAGLLNNLGNLYRETGDYDLADLYLHRALEMGERLRGPDSFYVSTTLQNLGIVARERKDYDTAKAYQLRALAIRERLEGPDGADVASLLVNLANVYRSMGDVTTSIDTQLRALRIWEATGGPYERGTLLSTGNLARAYAGIGDLTHAIEYQRRTDGLVELQLALDLAIGSERARLASARAMAERTDRTISLNLDLAPSNAEAANLAALVLLQRKGRVLDAMADTFATVRRHADAADMARLDELRATNAALSEAALTPRPDLSAAERRRAIQDLESRKEALERDLAARSAEFRAQMMPVTVEAVRGAIPDDAALIEFAVYRPFNPKIEHNAEAYGPPRYAAYVIRRREPPVGFDLGPVSEIDRTVDAFREALRDPRCPDFKTPARDLHRQLVAPLRSAIGGATRLLVAPDGALNLVPFDALVGEDGRYLIQRYAVTYLTSGRDLLRLEVPRVSRSNPVIVANPLFGEPPRGSGGGDVQRSLGEQPAGMYFAPLPSAALEARAIKSLFPTAELLVGRDATEARLAQLDAPRLLHIASHGFFLEDATSLPNPLLRSGLALAGANLPHAANGDGVLTALEAAGLNLWGTQLVTLSACDTGVGEVRNGEGVYGLRRAFVLAGTETLVMSLWPVSDRVTRDTMTAYYSGLRAGLGRGDALRQAKLSLLKRPDWSHPYYWASFIQSGEWAPLDNRR